jgi:hypothetical protein
MRGRFFFFLCGCEGSLSIFNFLLRKYMMYHVKKQEEEEEFFSYFLVL